MKAVKRLTARNFKNLCHQLAEAVPAFTKVVDTYGCPPLWQRPEGCGTLIKIILEQQVSLASGKAHFDRLNNFTNGLELAQLLNMTDDEYRHCHISRQKTSYIRSLATHIEEGTLNMEELTHLPDNEVAQKLCQVKGIGPWTASVYLMFSLGRPDHFPPGDIAAINAAKDLFPELQNASHADVLAFAANWTPLRTVASYLLWHWYLRQRNRSAEV